MTIGNIQPIGGTVMNTNSQNQGNAQNQERPNIWYKLVSMGDYDAITQAGSVTITVRVLPSISNGQCAYPIFEKDVSRTQFPNTRKWLMPILVINDQLHPESNGFAGVCEIPKTLNDLIEKKSPQNFYHPVNGYNFNVVVKITNGKDGRQFPNYASSYFEDQPQPIDFNPIGQYLQSLELLDFGVFVDRLNNPQPKNQPPQMSQRFVAAPAPQTQPAATFTPSTPQQQATYAPPQTQAPSFGQVNTFNPNQAPVQQNTQPIVQDKQTPTANFDDVFGGGDVPF